jgi:hypothetical protein
MLKEEINDFFRLPERLLRVQIIDKIKKGEYIIIRPFFN